jgi:hypothetical protein
VLEKARERDKKAENAKKAVKAREAKAQEDS